VTETRRSISKPMNVLTSSCTWARVCGVTRQVRPPLLQSHSTTYTYYMCMYIYVRLFITVRR